MQCHTKMAKKKEEEIFSWEKAIKLNYLMLNHQIIKLEKKQLD